MLRQIEGIVQRVGWVKALADISEVEDRELNHGDILKPGRKVIYSYDVLLTTLYWALPKFSARYYHA